jgi:DNA-binding MarR family transcriptional regulator
MASITAEIHPVTDSDVHALAMSLERVVTMVRRIVPSPEMSLTGVSTLRTLEMSGPARLTELAAAQSVTQPAMTQLVTRMERDGFVQRRSDKLDGRVVLVALTEEGQAFLMRRRDARARELGDLMNTLPEADRAMILAAVPALTMLADLGKDRR